MREDELTEALRNRIWDAVREVYCGDIEVDSGIDPHDYTYHFDLLSKRLRHHFFKIPIDQRSYPPFDELEWIRVRYFNLTFPGFYDFLELLADPLVAGFYRNQTGFMPDQFTGWCNLIFREEKTAFRFVKNLVTPITNEEERMAIGEAAGTDVAGTHIVQAITLYSDRAAPDYRNSIKESVSAVEAAYRRLTEEGHKDIKSAVAAMEKRGIKLPPSLKRGFSAIYGWTSGPDGIRHALMEDARPPDEAEARLMLVMCSAYVNYLLSLRGAASA